MLSRILRKKIASGFRRFSTVDDAVRASHAIKELPETVLNLVFYLK